MQYQADNSQKTILITGATDGIGFETAKQLLKQGHHILLHGRNAAKIEKQHQALNAFASQGGRISCYECDLSNLNAVRSFATKVIRQHTSLDVLINNAGVLQADTTVTVDNLDIRFAVNTLAPYQLTRDLLSIMPPNGRVINLSSAAQASVNLEALKGQVKLEAMSAYAQSKLAITSWSRTIAEQYKEHGPIMVAVNPGSLLATNMVKKGFGIAGSDINKGVDILIKAALSEEFATASGLYFDNDTGQFAQAHTDVYHCAKSTELMGTLDEILATIQ